MTLHIKIKPQPPLPRLRTEASDAFSVPPAFGDEAHQDHSTHELPSDIAETNPAGLNHPNARVHQQIEFSRSKMLREIAHTAVSDASQKLIESYGGEKATKSEYFALVRRERVIREHIKVISSAIKGVETGEWHSPRFERGRSFHLSDGCQYMDKILDANYPASPQRVGDELKIQGGDQALKCYGKHFGSTVMEQGKAINPLRYVMFAWVALPGDFGEYLDQLREDPLLHELNETSQEILQNVHLLQGKAYPKDGPRYGLICPVHKPSPEYPGQSAEEAAKQISETLDQWVNVLRVQQEAIWANELYKILDNSEEARRLIDEISPDMFVTLWAPASGFQGNNLSGKVAILNKFVEHETECRALEQPNQTLTVLARMADKTNVGRRLLSPVVNNLNRQLGEKPKQAQKASFHRNLSLGT